MGTEEDMIPSYHLLGKINAMGTLFSTRHLCLQLKWPTITENVEKNVPSVDFAQ